MDSKKQRKRERDFRERDLYERAPWRTGMAFRLRGLSGCRGHFLRMTNKASKQQFLNSPLWWLKLSAILNRTNRFNPSTFLDMSRSLYLPVCHSRGKHQTQKGFSNTTYSSFQTQARAIRGALVNNSSINPYRFESHNTILIIYRFLGRWHTTSKEARILRKQTNR